MAAPELDECVDALLAAVDRTRSALDHVEARARELQVRWREGEPVSEVVAAEEPPLVVTALTTVLEDLAEAGSAFRRAEARALKAEGLSQEAIAALFGVTRQRVAALLASRPQP
jgi:DNA-directed RNA polymerase specialized sigma24 family protein